jgi:hypothetical protein
MGTVHPRLRRTLEQVYGRHSQNPTPEAKGSRVRAGLPKGGAQDQHVSTETLNQSRH